MSLTIEQANALYALYPNAVRTNTNIAYDLDGNEIEYDLEAVNAKVAEMQAEEEAKAQAAHDKLSALGLTAEDLQRILGVK